MTAMRRSVFILISACAMTFVSFGCRKPSLPKAPASQSNIIVVMVDTLRADHMSLHSSDDE
jgi:hypothetical protein